jgi:hypothetical protein
LGQCQVDTANCRLTADCGAGALLAEAESAPVPAKPTDSMATDTTARSPADLRCMIKILLSFRFSIDVLLKSYCLCGGENTASNVSAKEIVAGRRLFPVEYLILMR